MNQAPLSSKYRSYIWNNDHTLDNSNEDTISMEIENEDLSTYEESVVLKLGYDADINKNWSKYVNLDIETSNEEAILGELYLDGKGNIIDPDNRVYPQHIEENCITDVTLMVHGNPWNRFSIGAFSKDRPKNMISATPADVAKFFGKLPKLRSIHLLSCQSREFGVALSMLLPNVEVKCYEHRITVKKPNLIIQNIQRNGVLRPAGRTDAYVFVSDGIGNPPKGTIHRADGLKETYNVPGKLLTDIETSNWYQAYTNKNKQKVKRRKKV